MNHLYVADNSKTKQMWEKAVENNPMMLKHALDHFLTKDICKKAIKDCSYAFIHVRNQHKNLRMCDKATLKDSRMLKLIRN